MVHGRGKMGTTPVTNAAQRASNAATSTSVPHLSFFIILFYFYFFLIYGFTLTRADSRRTRPIRPELGGIGRRPKLIETAETGRNRP